MPNAATTTEEDDSYSELLAELRGADPAAAARPYEVNLIGRWSELGRRAARTSREPETPLAGRNVEIAIEDADGAGAQCSRPWCRVAATRSAKAKAATSR